MWKSRDVKRLRNRAPTVQPQATKDKYATTLQRMMKQAIDRLRHHPTKRQSWQKIRDRMLAFVAVEPKDIHLDNAPADPKKCEELQEWLHIAATCDILLYIWLTQGRHNDHAYEDRNPHRIIEQAVKTILGVAFDRTHYERHMATLAPVITARESLVAVYGHPRIHFANLIPQRDHATSPPVQEEPATSKAENPLWVPYEKKVQVLAKGVRAVLKSTDKLEIKPQPIVSKYTELLEVSFHILAMLLKAVNTIYISGNTERSWQSFEEAAW